VVVANAEQLPFGDDKFDVVISVESSEHYHDIGRFLRETHRVLRPGGKLLLADLRWNGSFDSDWGAERSAAALRDQLAEAGFTVRQFDDIGPNVLRAIEMQDAMKQEGLARCGLADNEMKQFREIMLCVGSHNYEKMRRGDIRYLSTVSEAA
jgi:ubiquinone/menaquinone biosynthesis C-methylase UbiE